MSDNKVEITIGAKIDALITSFEEAQSAVGGSVEAIATAVTTAMASVDEAVNRAAAAMESMAARSKVAVEHTEGSLETLKKSINGLLVVMAAREGLEFMKGWAEKAEGIRNTAQTLGLTTDQVQRLDAAARLTGVSTEALHKSAGILAKNMQAAAEGNKAMQVELAKVGVTSQDYKDLNFDEVLGKIADRTADAKDGLEKMAVAKKLLGRAGTELIPLLDLGAAGIKAEGDEAEKTGAIMGVDMVNKGAALAEAIKHVGMIVQGFENMLADAFAPVLTMITDIMGEQSGAGEALAEVFKYLATAIEVAIGIIRNTWIYIRTIVQEVTNVIAAVIDEINRFLHFDWSGARAAAARGREAIVATFDEAVKDVRANAKRTAQAIAETWGDLQPPDLKKPKPAPTGGLDDDAGREKAAKQTRLQEWQNELDQKKLMMDAFHEMSLADEIKFWESKLALTKRGSNEETAVMHELITLKKKAAVEELNDQLNALKEQADAAAKGSQTRIDLARQELKLIAATYGERSNQYRAMEKQLEQYEREHTAMLVAAETERIRSAEKTAARLVDIERDHYQFLHDMGQLNDAQLLQAEAELEAHAYEIKKQALEKQRDIDGQTIEEKQKLNDELDQLEMDHARNVQHINQQAALNAKQVWQTYFDLITQGFTNTLMGMLNHTMTFKQGMLQLGQQLLTTFLQQEARKLAAYLAGQAAQKTAAIAGAAAKTAAETAGNAATTASNADTAVKSILSSGASVFGKIYDAIAGIPYIGPFIAPVMAAAGMAAVVGMVGKVASAEGGWERVPSDGQQAILHKDEMVLPAKLADSVRTMADSGASGGEMHIHIHAADSVDVRRLFENHSGALVGALKRHAQMSPGGY